MVPYRTTQFQASPGLCYNAAPMHPLRPAPTSSIQPLARRSDLRPADPARLQRALADFWTELAASAVQIAAQDHLAAHARLTRLRTLVLTCMVGLNGADLPEDLDGVADLLGPSQRAALQKTLAAPGVNPSAWVGQAVALVVIYRWYAPQLVEKFGLTYPALAESLALAKVGRFLPDWPQSITTE